MVSLLEPIQIDRFSIGPGPLGQREGFASATVTPTVGAADASLRPSSRPSDNRGWQSVVREGGKETAVDGLLRIHREIAFARASV